MFKTRIRELREAAGYKTQQSFADAFGVAQSTVGNWEAGKREPNHKTTLKLANFFGVSVDSLLIGEQSASPPVSTAVRIPVLGRVQAGIPLDAIEEILDWEEIPDELAKQGEFFALKVRGDSMEPRICDGDVVIVRQQTYADTGDVAIILVNGYDATIKKIKYQNDGIMLIPSNASYEPIFYSKEDIEKLPVEVIGKVVELRGKLD